MKNYSMVKSTLVLILFFSISAINAQMKKGVLRIKLKETKALFVQNSHMGTSAKGYALIGDKNLDSAMESCKASNMKRVFRSAGPFEAKHKKHGLHLWYEVTFDETVNIEEALKSFSDIEDVLISEPVHEKTSIGGEVVKIEAAALTTPTNDQFYDFQWHYENTGSNSGNGNGGTVDADIDLPEAWAIQTGIPEVVIAVIDGGIDVSHEDLEANIWENTSEIPNNNIDDDGNGYVDDVNGYNFGDNTGAINADDHGTHVGGTVAAVSNNNIGVAGVAGGSGQGDGVRLMSCSVFGNVGADGFDESFIYAADNGAVIAQNSWGYTQVGVFDQSVLDAIDYFIEEAGYDANGNPIGPMQGGIVIFAAGNDGVDGDWYPGVYEPVLAVGSTDLNDDASDFSNRGDWVDIAAPGSDIVSTYPDNSYGYNTGTSMACPHVSGVAGLIVSQFANNITPDEVRSRLVDNTDPLPFDFLGSGRLNALAALSVDGDEGEEPGDEDDVFPDPTKTYYIDNLRWDVRLGADGTEEPFTTSIGTTGDNVEWTITESTVDGFYFIDCVGGGTVPRLRSDQSTFADMQETSSNGIWERWSFTSIDDGEFYLTTQNDSNFDRLRVNSSRRVETVASNFTGQWTHFTFTEVGASTSSNSIESVAIGTEMLVYPVPAVNYINVANLENKEYKMIEIQDMSGNVESSKVIADPSSLQIDVSELPKGIHFLRLLDTNGEEEVLRFTK